MAGHIDLDTDLFKAFAFYAIIVLLKTIAMAFVTARTRYSKKVFANPEDAKGKKEAKVKLDDPDVERVRRAHLNDMENIYPFVFISFIYCLTRPDYVTALWHFRVFAAARIAHSIVYVGQVPQPARALTFAVGLFVCISMAVQVLRAVI